MSKAWILVSLFIIAEGGGVPGVRIRGVEIQQCQCTEIGCGCATGLYCGGGGQCYSCSQLDCRGFPNAGCVGCDGGTACDQSTGKCTISGSIPSTCQGLSCTTGQGSPVWDGSACRCQCLPQYSGTVCDVCAYGYSNYPSCIANTQCNGVVCKNGGSASIQSGTCACQCPTGYAGATCEYCSSGYRGYPQCVSDYSQDCISSSLCYGYGTAYWSVSLNRCICQCDPQYTGDRCTACATGYTNYPTCGSTTTNACTTTQCFGKGTGYWDGVACTCTCSTGYAGTLCNSCAAGYTGYPTCVVVGTTPGVTLPPDQATYYQLGDCFATNGYQMTSSSKSVVSTETATACCDQCRRTACIGWNFLTSSKSCELLSASGPLVSNADSLYGHSSTTATSPLSSSDDDSLITALAIIGALLLLCCLLCLLWWFCCRKKKKKQPPPEPKEDFVYPPAPAPAVYPPYDYSPRPPSENSDSPEVYIHNPEHNPIYFPQKPQPHLPNDGVGEGGPSPERPLPLLTVQNTEHNNFLHRRDNTFA